MEQPKWTIETVEEWIHIATLVDKSLPPVIHKGVRGQRIEIIREWYELLWDAEEMKKLGLVNINLALQPFLEGDERHGKAEDAAACKRAWFFRRQRPGIPL